MTGWLIFVGVIVLVALFPVGGSVKYDADGPGAKLILGPFSIRLYPKPGKEKEKKQPGKEASQTAEKKPRAKDDLSTLPEDQGGSIADFLPLVQVALDMLGGLRRKLRVNYLQLRLTMAGDDPCDLAVNYGRANAAGAALMAQLERLFVIKKRDVGIACDFESEETRILARLDLTITIGRAISLVTVYGIRALTTYMKIKKQREEGGA